RNLALLLGFEFVKQLLNGMLNLVNSNGTLLASLDKAGLKLVPVEGFMAPVTLDCAQLDTLDLFVGGVTGFATEALATSGDAITVFGKTRIKHLILKGTALRATHCGALTLFCEFTTRS